jgi:hypothetical protein
MPRLWGGGGDDLFRARNGTERCAEVAAKLPGFDVVVNLQGDAPLTPAWFVEDLVAGLLADPAADIATPVLRCDGRALNGFLADRRAGRVGGTTAVFGAGMRALYFSKEVIPFTGKTYADDDETPVFHHVGVYAYRPAALAAYPSWPIGPLETLEGLEQLRFLENGPAGAVRRGAGQGPAVLGTEQPQRRAGDRGDDGDRPAGGAEGPPTWIRAPSPICGRTGRWAWAMPSGARAADRQRTLCRAAAR